jgi:hypothetical protein
MSETPIDKRKSQQLFLALNVLNVAFYIYLITRVMNIGDMRQIGRDYNTQIILGIIFLSIVLRSRASKIGGGAKNPIILDPKAKAFHYAALAFFFCGLLATTLNHNAFVITILSVPLEIIAVYFTLQYLKQDKADSELLDDFDLDD